MKTLSEIIEWLKQPDHIRIILVEVSDVKVQGSPTTLYLSSKAFTSSTSDMPANTSYDPCIVSGLSFTESLSLDGSASIGFGDIEVSNINGERDAWLNYIWSNRSINIYIGDPRWNKEDFYRIFTGVLSDISARDRNSLNLIILDKLERLNKPISEELLGGTGNNKDRVKPLLFGECFNIEPLYISDVPANLEYLVHNGAIERVIEVRDNGVPLVGSSAPSINLANGTITLVKSPAGQITASVQGTKPSGTYTNNIANIIKYIVKTYGQIHSKLSDSDINLTNFSTFASTNTQPVGIYCKDKENILDICQQLASSIGASVCFDSQGLLRLVRLAIPGSGTVYNVTSDDMELNSVSISEKVQVKASVKLGYCKNWTPQTSGMATGIPATHLPVFSRDWYEKSVVDASVNTEYKLYEQAEQEDTLLLRESDATAEANRRNTLWKSPRFIVTATYFSHLLPVELGDVLNITHPRFNLQNTSGLVIDISRDWVTGRVTIGVLI